MCTVDSSLFPPNLLHQVVNANPHFIFVKNPEGRFMFVNQALADFYGKAVHELIGKLEQEIFPASDAIPLFRQTDREVFQSKQPLHAFEESFVDPRSGQTHFFETTKVPLATSKGEVFAILGIATEITQSKKSALALAHNLSLGQVVADLSNQFIQLDYAAIDDAIRQALHRVGHFMSAMSMSLFLCDETHNHLTCHHHWQANPQEIDTSPNSLSVEALDWSMAQLREGHLVTIGDRSKLPEQARFEKAWLEQQQATASLMLPVAYQHAMMGFIKVDFAQQQSWPEENLMLLQIFADTLANSLMRRVADEALRQSFAKQQATLRAMPDLMFTLDKEGNYLEIQLDDEHPDNVGLIGKNLRDVPFLSPELTELFIDNLNQAVENKQVMTLNYQTSLPRDPSYYEARFIAVDDERVLMLVRDTSEQVRASQALQQSEHRYRQLFAAAERQARELLILDRVRAAVAKDIDRQTFIERTVEAIAELGYTHISLALIQQASLVVQHALGYAHLVASLPLDRGVMGYVARTGEAKLVKVGDHQPDDLWFLADTRTAVCVPLKDQDNVVGVLTIEGTTANAFDEDDLTLMLALSEQIGLGLERTRYHEESLENASRFRAIFEETFQYMGLLTPQGVILEANQSILDLLQMQKESLQGRSLDSEVFWRSAPSYAKTMRLAVDRAAQGHFVRLELNIPQKTRDLAIDLSIKPIKDRDGKVILLIPEGRDISVLKEAQQVLTEREHLLRILTQNMNDVVCLHDPEANFIYVSPSSFQMLGYEAQELMKLNAYKDNLCHPKDQRRIRRELGQIIKEKAFERPITYRFQHRQGHYIWLESYLRPMVSDNYPPNTMISSTREVTAKQEASNALLESEAFLRQVIDTSPLAIYVKDKQGKFSLVNKAMARIYQSTPEAMIGKTELDFGLSTESYTYLHELDQEVIASNEAITVSEHQVSLSHSQPIWFQTTRAPLRSSSGTVRGVLVISTDITERKRNQDLLTRSALYDSLTGLPNRSLFLDRLKQAISRQQREQASHFAVMFLDLDRFKVINDSLGHSVGDDLLITLGQRLVESIRSADTVARMGGDEFALLLENISQEEVIFAANRLQEVLSQPLLLQGHEVFTTASIGITFSKQGATTESEVLRRADIAMYHAKNSGKARYAIFDQDMHERAVGMQRMEADLRRALEKQEFHLVFQPIIHLNTQTLIGFEALIRWQHSRRGLIRPDLFIPIAEETGMIVDIGSWVLQTACQRLAAWGKKFPHRQVTMSVNVSTKQFLLPDFSEQVARVLQQTQIEPARLKLEITESTLMQNANSNAIILENLRSQGINIQIDDFGTGYSSLNYLHSLPLDSIKIDRSFVSNMDHHEKHLEIVKTIVALGHSLGLDLVAEGIETEAQLLQIRALGCQFGQGYLFAKPLSQRDVETTWLL